MPNKTINIIRFAHWEKASLSLRAKALGFSRYCKRYVPNFMNIEDVKKKLEISPYRDERDISGLFDVFLSLYESDRIDETDSESDGDMILFQYGTFDWGSGNYFELNLTRQVIPDTNDIDYNTDNMQQLSIAFKYVPCEKTKSLGDDNKWCNSPNNISDFKSFIRDSEPYNWAMQVRPALVEIELSFI